MKIGLFFGTFNPIHQGHLSIADFMLNETDIHHILFIVSPQNPLKLNVDLLNKNIRLEMVTLAIKGNTHMEASDIEFFSSKPNYTIDTLKQLQVQYPDDELILILGSDNLYNFNQWKNYKTILSEFKIYTYLRPEFINAPFTDHPNVTLFKSILLNISATQIRKSIAAGQTIIDVLPNKVFEYITKHRLYK